MSEIDRILRLQGYMARWGITQAGLAAVLGLKQNTISIMLRQPFISRRNRDRLLKAGLPEDLLPREREIVKPLSRKEIKEALARVSAQ